MRISGVVLVCCLCLVPSAMGAGFVGPGAGSLAPTVTRATEVAMAGDDTPCVLEGHIVEKIPQRKERYIFRDESGTVVVEIEDETFGHLTVRPENRVRLVGNVEWDSKRPNEVEVDALAILE